MFRDSHFRYEDKPTPQGIRVSVTHMPTNKVRVLDIGVEESVGAAFARLRKEIESELPSPGDFRVRTSRRGTMTLVVVTHKPSRISRQVAVSREDVHDASNRLVDEIMLELAGEDSRTVNNG